MQSIDDSSSRRGTLSSDEEITRPDATTLIDVEGSDCK
jgi:hypothetical protein